VAPRGMGRFSHILSTRSCRAGLGGCSTDPARFRAHSCQPPIQAERCSTHHAWPQPGASLREAPSTGADHAGSRPGRTALPTGNPTAVIKDTLLTRCRRTLLEFRRRRARMLLRVLAHTYYLTPLPAATMSSAGVLRSARRARRRNSFVRRWPANDNSTSRYHSPHQGGPHGPPPPRRPSGRHNWGGARGGHIYRCLCLPATPSSPPSCLYPAYSAEGWRLTLLEFRRRRVHTSRRVRTLRRRLAPPTYSARLAPVFSGAAAGCGGGTHLFSDGAPPKRLRYPSGSISREVGLPPPALARPGSPRPLRLPATHTANRDVPGCGTHGSADPTSP
jgi:hypothetical protein